jgi:hypothetical protein
VNFHEIKNREESSFFWSKFQIIPVNFSNRKLRYKFPVAEINRDNLELAPKE